MFCYEFSHWFKLHVHADGRAAVHSATTHEFNSATTRSGIQYATTHSVVEIVVDAAGHFALHSATTHSATHPATRSVSYSFRLPSVLQYHLPLIVALTLLIMLVVHASHSATVAAAYFAIHSAVHSSVYQLWY